MKLGPYNLDQVHCGYVPGVLRAVPTESVHMVCTSPPYWGLRVYEGVEAQGWADGSRCCLGLEETPEIYVDHMLEVFREVHRVLRHDGTLWLNMGDCYATGAGKVGNCPGGGKQGENWKGAPTQPNRMPIPGLKTKDLVGMPWRLALALQADGAASPSTMAVVERVRSALLADFETWEAVPDRTRGEIERLDKEWEGAHEGAWYLRADVIWHKPSPMPESASDRPTKAHEYVFLLSKSAKYFYDAHAIREPSSWNSHPRGNGANPKAKEPAGWDTGPGNHQGKAGRYPSKAARDVERAFNRRRKTSPGPRQNESFSAAVTEVLPFRNKRSVWRIPVTPCKAAHFATFPPGLVLPMVRAGTSEKGVCGACGAPWRRVLAHKTPLPREEVEGTKYSGAGERVAGNRIRESTKGARAAGGDHDNPFPAPEHKGWELSCRCRLFQDLKPAPAIVLDPFAGSGTAVAVAMGLGRRALGFEASAEYVEKIVPARIAGILAKKALFKDDE